jgi:hypothetical protein
MPASSRAVDGETAFQSGDERPARPSARRADSSAAIARAWSGGAIESTSSDARDDRVDVGDELEPRLLGEGRASARCGRRPS